MSPSHLPVKLKSDHTRKEIVINMLNYIKFGCLCENKDLCVIFAKV
jgi:hypothetical protein